MKKLIKKITVAVTTWVILVALPIFTFADVVGVPLTGLTWYGKPCVNILVPNFLPQEFITNANGCMVDKQRIGDLIALAFAVGDDVIISAWAVEQCPAFVALDLFNMKTDEARYWVYNPAGKFREVTLEEHSKVLDAVTPEMIKAYCTDKKANKISFITAVEEEPTAAQVKNWTKVDSATVIGPCGPWFVLINPNKQSRYKVGYLHFHGIAREMVPVRYGFLDRDGAKHFVLEGDVWIKSPHPISNAEEVMREHLPKKTGI